MGLRFGGARADRPPRDEVRDVLRRQQVEELRAARQPHAVDAQEELPREAQPRVDGEAAVEVRVVDESFPAHRGARLLEVDAHHDEELGGVARGGLVQARGVLQRRAGIVDRARPDDGEQPIVGAVQDAVDRLARVGDGRERRRVHRQLLEQQLRRDQRADGADAQVVRAPGDGPRFIRLGSVPGVQRHNFHVIPPRPRGACAPLRPACRAT